MARVLVIHHEKGMRTILETLIKRWHDVTSAKHLEAGAKILRKKPPELVVVGQDATMREGERLLRYMKQNNLRIPVVVVVARTASKFSEMMQKLGARGFLEYPAEASRLPTVLEQAISSPAPGSDKTSEDAGKIPPISHEELNSNLSILETKLNRAMTCVGGKNQVYIQSVIAGGLNRSKPRIALKCPWRAEYGMPRDVFYEYIRDVCCGDPTQCEAHRRFEATRRGNA